MYLTSLEEHNYRPPLEQLTCCGKCCVSKLTHNKHYPVEHPTTGENQIIIIIIIYIYIYIYI